MKDLLEKLSSYNIFNNLFPGVLFAAIGDRLTALPLLFENLIVGVFVYYFYGVVISRIGSLVIEPLLKWSRLVKFDSYDHFIEAADSDEKLEVLSETNNMYRTLISVIVCIFGLLIYDIVLVRCPSITQYSPYIGLTLLVSIFILSYRKQSEYMNARVGRVKKKQMSDDSWNGKP